MPETAPAHPACAAFADPEESRDLCRITYDGGMARWQPETALRLVVAAVDLFTEQGYDATTVAQIAERAGVTKSTFFRHFPDKRELLVAGQETLSRLLADGIAEAPADASPLEAVAAGLERASGAMGPANRELGPRLKAAVAASTELSERDALKSVGLAAAMTSALIARGVPDPTAHLAGELGVLAFKRGYNEWSEGDRDDASGLAQYALAALDDLRTAATTLS
jgi:AcrR family transcriptional regulator